MILPAVQLLTALSLAITAYGEHSGFEVDQ